MHVFCYSSKQTIKQLNNAEIPYKHQVVNMTLKNIYKVTKLYRKILNVKPLRERIKGEIWGFFQSDCETLPSLANSKQLKRKLRGQTRGVHKCFPGTKTWKGAVPATPPLNKGCWEVPQVEPALWAARCCQGGVMDKDGSTKGRMKLQPGGFGQKNVNFLAGNSEYFPSITSKEIEGIQKKK